MDRFVRTVLGILLAWLAAADTWGQIEKREATGTIGILPPAAFDRSPMALEIREQLAANRLSEARQLAELLSRREPQNYEGYFWLGFIDLAQGGLYSAVKHLRQAESRDPPGNAVQKVLGVSYWLLGQRLLFEMKMKEAIALDQADFVPPYLLGRYLQFDKQDPKGAIHQFQQALERRPDHYPSVYYMGMWYESEIKPAEAKEWFERAIALAKHQGANFSLPYQGLARLSRPDDPEASLKFAEQAVALEPKLPGNHIELGKSYARRGRLEEAVEALKTAISLDPNEKSAHYHLSTLYKRLGDRQKAEHALAEFQRRTSCYGTQ